MVAFLTVLQKLLKSVQKKVVASAVVPDVAQESVSRLRHSRFPSYSDCSVAGETMTTHQLEQLRVTSPETRQSFPPETRVMAISTILSRSSVFNGAQHYSHSPSSGRGVSIHWTGLLDWTTGLIFLPLKINFMLSN